MVTDSSDARTAPTFSFITARSRETDTAACRRATTWNLKSSKARKDHRPRTSSRSLERPQTLPPASRLAAEHQRRRDRLVFSFHSFPRKANFSPAQKNFLQRFAFSS